MDDDLMSLRGDDSNDDDLFGGFEDSSSDFDFDFGDLDTGDATALETAAGTSTSEDQDIPDWMRELDQPESLRATQPAATVASSAAAVTAAPARRDRARKPRATTARKSSMGLTPMQRMVLAIFLFLDVAVIGFSLLIGLNIIAF